MRGGIEVFPIPHLFFSLCLSDGLLFGQCSHVPFHRRNWQGTESKTSVLNAVCRTEQGT